MFCKLHCSQHTIGWKPINVFSCCIIVKTLQPHWRTLYCSVSLSIWTVLEILLSSHHTAPSCCESIHSSIHPLICILYITFTGKCLSVILYSRNPLVCCRLYVHSKKVHLFKKIHLYKKVHIYRKVDLYKKSI